ncbi:hypothetical protein KY345_00570 [Candidatus Woesearchaeota archaeon]|nr:hypothetical protein [Candidatus Woesearchaeota archaeon]
MEDIRKYEGKLVYFTYEKAAHRGIVKDGRCYSIDVACNNNSLGLGLTWTDEPVTSICPLPEPSELELSVQKALKKGSDKINLKMQIKKFFCR